MGGRACAKVDAKSLETLPSSDFQPTVGLAVEPVPSLQVEGTPATPQVIVDPISKETGSHQHNEVFTMESAAQKGLDAVERMAESAQADSPVFLSDMVKTSKKRRRNDDGEWFF